MIDGALSVLDASWKWSGAKGGFQDEEENGACFENWYWRSSVLSASGVERERVVETP